MNRIHILTIMVVFLCYTCVSAQESSEFSKKELLLGVNFSGNSYYGDINYNPNGGYLSSNTYLNVNPGVHFTFRQNQPNFFSMVFTGGYAQILAQNPDLAPFYYGDPADPRSLYIAPRYVSTDYLYGDVNVRFSPVRKIRALVRPYLQTGAGALLFFPLKNGSVRPKGANLERGESFSTISFSTNAMLGTDINFSKHASLNLGTQLRLPMTDYMDWYGGKNVNSFRKQSGDLIFSILVGANFKIFETNRPTIFQPRILNNLHQEKLPEDSIVLASIDNDILPYLFPKNNDEPYNYYQSLVYPEDWIPLAVLAKSIDCDSLARIADQRISVLYAENLQLRAQYTKIENKTNNSPSLANNGGDEELKRMLAETQAESEMSKVQASAMKEANEKLLDKVAELESKMVAMQVENEAKSNPVPAPTATAGNEDSLIRVIMQKENEIAKLQELLKQGPQTGSLGESEKLAELEKENLALKAENEDLRNGTQNVSEMPGFVELQGRYNGLLIQNEELQKELEVEKDNNKSLVFRIEQEHQNGLSTQGDINKEIDSLKRETLILYTEVSNQANAQMIKDSIAQVEMEQMNGLLAAANERIKTLETATPTTNPADTEGIQAALAEALAQKNATDAKYAELQENINKYESEIVATKQSNDSLLVVVQNLQASNPTTNPTPTEETAEVRFESLKAELEEVRAVALKAQEDKNVAEENLVASKKEVADLTDRITELQNNGSSGYAAEFQYARNRIDSLERAIEELTIRYTMSDPTGTAPVAASSAYQNLQSQLEVANKEITDLENENKDLKQAVATLSSGVDAAAVMDMRNELDAAKREKENLLTLTESQKSRIADLEEKANNAIPIIPVASNEGGGDSLEIAVLKERVEELSQDKEALVNRNGEMQAEINRLEGLVANKESNPQPGVVAAVSQEEFDLMKKSVDIMSAENTELKQKNESLQTQINAIVGTDPDERTLQIQQLENENTLLRQQVTKFAMLNAEMADLQNKALELETENKNLKAISGGTISDAAVNGRLAEKEDEISALQTQLADVTGKYDAQKHEYDLLVESKKVDNSATLEAKVEEMTATVSGLQARVTELTNENDSLMNSSAAGEVAVLRTQVEELRGSNAELLQKLNDAEDKLVANEEVMNGLKKAYEEVSARVGNPEATAQLNEKVTQLQGELVEANKKLEASAELEAQATTLNAQLSESETANSALKSEIETLTGTIAEQKVQLENNRPVGAEELAIMKKEIERLNEELKNSNPTSEATLREIADLQEDNRRKQAKIDELLANTVGISSEEIKAQFEALQADNANKQMAIDSLQALVNNSATSPSEIEAEMKAQIAVLQEENNKKQAEIDRLSNVAIPIPTGNPEEALVALQTQIAVLQEENNKKQAEIEKLQGFIANPTPTSNEGAAELQAQITVLNGQLAEKEANNQQLATQVQTLSGEVADLTEQKIQLEKMQPVGAGEVAILKKEIERLNAELANGGNGDAQAQIAVLQADKEKLVDEVGRLNVLISDMGKEGGSDAKVAEMQALVSQKEEENTALRKQVEDAPSVQAFANLQMQLEEALKGNPAPAVDGEVLALREAIQEKEGQILELKEKLAAAPDAEEMANLKVRNESLTAQIEEQETEMIKMATTLAEWEDKNGESTALVEEVVTLKKQLAEGQDVTALQVQIQNLTAENGQLKEENVQLRAGGNPIPVDNSALVADLQQQIENKDKEIQRLRMESGSEGIIAGLQAENEQLRAEIANLKTGVPTDNSAEIIALQNQIAQQKAELDQIKSNPAIDNESKAIIAGLENKIAEKDALIAQLQQGATPESGLQEMVDALKVQIQNQEAQIVQLKTNQMDTNTANIMEERDAVRKQNEEIFKENEDYRNALGNALAALDAARNGSRMPSPELQDQNTQLLAKVEELEIALRNAGGSDEKKLEALQAQLSNALASNDELQKELEIAKSMSGGGIPNNEEANLLKAANNDLKNQLSIKNADISDLQAQVAQQAQMVTANEQKIGQLETEIRGLRENINVNPIATNNINSLQRIDSFKMVISSLQGQISVMSQNQNNNNASTAGNNVSITQQQLNQKVAEIEAREKRSKAREEYIESLNLDYQLQVEKGKYLNAKEIELQILSQKLNGFPDYFAEITQDDAPCSTVSASLDKQEVMERINSYFNTLGYKFRTDNGKMIFENVTIPEISKKPVNVVFYLMTSKSGKRIFQGVFQFVDNKNYITADRYPNETTRVLKLMQRLSQQ